MMSGDDVRGVHDIDSKHFDLSCNNDLLDSLAIQTEAIRRVRDIAMAGKRQGRQGWPWGKWGLNI